MLGNKWRLPWDVNLDVYAASDTIILTTVDDNLFKLEADFSGTYLPSNAPNWDVKGIHITTGTEAYEVTDEDDKVYRFEYIASKWRLKSIKERTGYVQTVAYDANGLVTTVTDSLARTLTFTYETFAGVPEAQRAVIRIVAPGGVQIDYTYFRTTNSSTAQPDYPTAVLKTAKVSVPPATASETTTYHYENATNKMLLSGVTDARSVRVSTIIYDTSGRVTSTELAGGADKIIISYNDTTGARTVTNALGKSATFNFSTTSGLQLLTGVNGLVSTNCPASSTSLTYDGNGYPATTTDEEGRVTSIVRDGRGLPTSITRGFGTPQAVTTMYTYDPTYRVPTQMVEPGKTTNYTWTTGRLTQMSEVDTTSGSVPYSSNGQTRTTAYTYTGTSGLLASVNGPLAGTGDTVSYAYDANGYVNTVTNEVGHVTTVNTKNARGQPTQVTDPNGVVSNLTYDFQGRLLTVTVNPGASQAVTTMTYDSIGQITKVTRPDGSWFSYTYDNARRLTTVTSINSETINYTRDLLGNVTAMTIKNAGGTIVFSQTQTFDELGRLLKNIGAATQTTTYGYEKNDNLKSVTDPRVGVYAYAYDSLNRLIRETDQETSQVNYTLDGQDNVTTYADPRNLQTTYIRNGFGEVKRQTSPDSGNTDYVYDLRGLVTQMTDARAIVTNMTYDNAGRQLTKSFPAATTENVTMAYDSIVSGNKGKGRLTSLTHEGGSIALTYDVRGNVTREARVITASGTTARNIDYVYNAADLVTLMTYPSGRQVQYTRDTTGRITAVKSRKISTDAYANITTAITYQPISKLVKSFTHGNALTHTNTHSLDYELTVLNLKNGTTDAIKQSYARTDSLNITGITDNVTAANTQTLWANPANRLQNADGPWGAKTFYYDGVGNRTYENTTVASVTTSDQCTYPTTSNRLTSIVRAASTIRSMTYDGAGNIATDTRSGTAYAYAYNKANRLKTVTVAGNLLATYTYNGREQLISRVITNSGTLNGTTHFIHDLEGNVIAELNATGATVKEYIYLPEAEIAPTRQSRTTVDMPVAVVTAVNTATPATFMVHVDHLNRPIRMTDGAKASVWDAVWTPWGSAYSITGAQTLDARFPGQWFQTEAGLHYNWHRHYDPSLGRYTQPDPLGFVDGPSVYAYVGNEPTGDIDIDGLTRSRRPGGGGPQSFLTRPGVNPNALEYPPRLPNYSPPARGLPPRNTYPPNIRPDQCYEAPASRPTEAARGGRSLFDRLGGEWRWHPGDRYHNPHWDYKPPGNPNHQWQNIPQTPNTPVMKK